MKLTILVVVTSVFAVAFHLGRWTVGGISKKEHKRISRSDTNNNEFISKYFLGLNYLISEQQDKAVDVFIRMLEINDDTVEMHVALGSLFRRKGEVDRAIKIHQNLIDRSQLNDFQRETAISELAQDYLKAGVLDRAEGLFRELIDIDEDNTANYHFLLKIYEQQKDWRQAIVVAKQLTKIRKSSDDQSWIPTSYYYCELASEFLSCKVYEQAEINLKKALVCDKNCVRASVMLGSIAEVLGDYKGALSYYQQIKNQDLDFFSEVIDGIAICFEKLDKVDQFIDNILSTMKDNYSSALVFKFFPYYKKYKNESSVLGFILDKCWENASLLLFKIFVEFFFASRYLRTYELGATSETTSGDDGSGVDTGNTKLIQNFIIKNFDKLLITIPLYRCVDCGLETKLHYWQCPNCRKWASVKPIKN